MQCSASYCFKYHITVRTKNIQTKQIREKNIISYGKSPMLFQEMKKKLNQEYLAIHQQLSGMHSDDMVVSINDTCTFFEHCPVEADESYTMTTT